MQAATDTEDLCENDRTEVEQWKTSRVGCLWSPAEAVAIRVIDQAFCNTGQIWGLDGGAVMGETFLEMDC